MEGMREKIEEILQVEPLKDHGLKLIGIGADKIVFETPGSTKKVIKISKDFITQKIGLLFGIGDKTKIGSNNESEAVEYQKKLIAEHNNIENDLSEIFGKEHLLRKGVFKAKIPVTKEMILKLMSNEKFIPIIEKLDDNTVYEIETLAETQIIAEELKDKKKFKTESFDVGLISEDNFRKGSDLQSGMSYIKQDIEKHFLTVFDYNSEVDKDYPAIVKDIVTKIIKYTKNTGRIIDIFGPYNFTIFKKDDGSSDYHLLDPILPGKPEYWDTNIKDDNNFDILRHNYTYYYAISSLANKLGIKDTLETEDLNYFKGSGIPTEGKFNIKE